MNISIVHGDEARLLFAIAIVRLIIIYDWLSHNWFRSWYNNYFMYGLVFPIVALHASTFHCLQSRAKHLLWSGGSYSFCFTSHTITSISVKYKTNSSAYSAWIYEYYYHVTLETTCVMVSEMHNTVDRLGIFLLLQL